jgi:hypothetical protein
MAFVSCDPHRLASLAAKLQALVDVLRSDGMTARTLLQSWGSWSADGLPALINELQEVATAVAGRADRAQQSHQLGGGFNLGSPILNGPAFTTSPMIQLPWDTQDQAIAEAAKDQAVALQQALANPKDPGSRAVIDRISQDLADNQDDPTYLQAFMKAGGLADSAQVPRALHQEDGTTSYGAVLSSDSQEIVSRYASAVQAATSSAAAGKIDIGDYKNILSNPPNKDMWSMSQLLANGPMGAQWDPGLLDAVGTSVLKWRATVAQRPGVDYPEGIDAEGMPATFNNPGDAWYNSLGLAPHGNIDSSSNAALISDIKMNDPTLAVLQAISDNQSAAIGLLSDSQHGLDNATALVSNQWTNDNFDGSSDGYFPGQIVTIATQYRGGDPNGQNSALAALNVMQAAQALYIADKKNPSMQPSAPPEISDALENVASTYLDDLARSANVTPQTAAGTDQNPTVTRLSDGQWVLTVNQGQINGLLAEAFADGGNANIFNTAIQAGAYGAVHQSLVGKDPNPSYDEYAALLGISFSTQHAAAYYDAQSQDQAAASANAADQAYVNAITGAAGNLPLDGVPLGLGQAFTGFMAPFWANKVGTQPTNNAQKASDVTQAQREAAWQSMQVPALQALMDTGKITVPPPQGAPWYQNGKILPGKVDGSFQAWVLNNQSTVAALKPYDGLASQAFTNITSLTNPGDSQFGNNP